jgi:hypothetical protein
MGKGQAPDGAIFDIPGVATLGFDAISRSVMVTWCGHATAQDFQSLLQAELEALRAHGASNLLTDLKRQPPLDQQAQDGAYRDWLPSALAAGLKRFAVVLPDNREAAVNIEDRLGRVSRDQLEVGFFHSIDDARDWLNR